MKYKIITFGCQMNYSDSERIAKILESIGYRPAPEKGKADLVVVNMCSVRQSAVDRVYGKVKNFSGPNKKIKTILTGCMLKNDKIKLEKKFDYVLNIKTLPEWPKIISSPAKKHKKNIKAKNDYLSIVPKRQTNFSASIPISTGCNNFCSYCVVPYTRGPLICRDYREIIKEAKSAIKNGAKEIWLLGENVNQYYSKIKAKSQKTKTINFAKLLGKIDQIPGNFWIRFTSPNPINFSDELIKSIAKYKKISPYLNLPAQSGDNDILKKMRRPYTVSQYKNLVKKIKSAFKKYRTGIEKNIALSTDIIVGFPGETKKQFENTADLLKKIKYDMAYIARYSPRKGTEAFKFKDNVPQKEKKRREKILTKILKETSLQNNKKYIGKTIEVLVQKYKNGYFIGKSFHYKTVKFSIINHKKSKMQAKPKPTMPILDQYKKVKGDNLIGRFVKIKITNALAWGLEGKLI